MSGSNLTLGDADVEAAGELLASTAVLVLQNEIPDAANVAAAKRVRSAGGEVLLNAAPARNLSSDLAALVDVLVVNAIEAEMLSGTNVVETLEGALAAADVSPEPIRMSSSLPRGLVSPMRMRRAKP